VSFLLNPFLCLSKEKDFVFADETAIQFTIAAGDSSGFWIPAFAGMTS